ncbi:MAG: hypothetical protein LBU96_11925 [Yokenella regensburgei]|jgi:hypothetical protein|nr:hypothetical protein [Yokenella regensburgei]
MASLNHIPFGIRIEDQQFVDVADVPKGRDCGCVCPSCAIPLIARQGQANRWHFAHASRKVDEVETECAFSFYVSVRMMAKQLLEEGLSLDLPAWEDVIFDEQFGLTEHFWITNGSSNVVLEGVKKEHMFEGVLVDIYGKVNAYPLVVYFTHPERSLPLELLNPEQQGGVLEIRLDETRKLFTNKNSKDIKFIDELRPYLQNQPEARRWVYHPRQDKARQEAQNILNERVAAHPAEVTSEPTYYNKKPRNYRWRHYQCSICLWKWSSPEYELPRCPNCRRGRLYARKIG